MTTKEIKIEGMSCGHCEMAVRKELSRLENVKIKEVKIGKAIVEYDENKVKEELLYNAVEKAGYNPIK